MEGPEADYAGQEHIVRQGHIQGGLFFLIWGLYWTVCIFHAYLLQQFPATAKGKKQLPASANAAPYTFPSYQGTRWQLVEPVAKAVLGLYGVTWAFHHQLACLGIRSGDCWRLLDAAGHLDHMHIGSFQHGFMSLCLLLGGLVGLLCLAFPLPAGTEHGIHVVGFLAESLVFWYHIKPSPLDHVVHVMAGYCWLGLAATSALQCVQPRAFLLACARTLLMLLQGAWSIQNAYIMFSGADHWNKDAPGPPHYVPVLFATYAVALLFAYMAGYLAMMFAYHKLGWITLPGGSCSWSRLTRSTSSSPRQNLSSGPASIATGRPARLSVSSGSGVLPLSKGCARLDSHDLEGSASESEGWLLAAAQQGARARHAL
ncbi:hypothetical protein OEZ85_010890 [Tetradesmus obliquus]|uniref:TLC domain-containing protein n=1 Tax=Tetradesmus obliquus TaxID=3088 RepID=A0ABY8TQY4_TETOB|nr:hypothetical protein OEZ85_010890 [Tetradesmus obliquus]